MTENIGVLLIATAGLVGVILGIYALAPVIFQKRLRNLMTVLTPDEARIVQEEIALMEEEKARAEAFGLPTGRPQLRVVVPSRGPGPGESPPPVDPMPDVDQPAAWQSIAMTALARQRTTADAPAPVAPAAVEPDPIAMEIFRDLKPAAGAMSQRARPAPIREAQAHAVAIRELLSEARWTARGLRPSPGTMRYARRRR